MLMILRVVARRGQTLEMLEKKEKVLQKKIAVEIEKAKEFSRVKNKRGELGARSSFVTA